MKRIHRDITQQNTEKAMKEKQIKKTHSIDQAICKWIITIALYPMKATY